jgi:tetratricopeptide (TPR) repeat protein
MRIVSAFGAAMFMFLSFFAATPASAVFEGDTSKRVRSSDSDYADGMEAWDREDWPAVADAMKKVVARRPHHGNAWTRLGYANRKMKNYDAALYAYGRALKLNPRDRPALEYLGEAYVELGRMSDAKAMLDRLAEECKRGMLTYSDRGFSHACGEFTDLKEAYEATGEKSGY